MKHLLRTLFLLFFAAIHGQSQNYIHTSGKHILGPCNDTLSLRGVNYAPYNWGYTLNDLKLDQIALTGANVVRMPWYANNQGASIYSNYVALDSAISKCVHYKMIPIIELHDFTCGNNSTNLITGTSWWTSSPVLTILQKYKHSVIVNIANEALQVSWASNPSAALTTYKNTYQTIITNLRNVSGFDFPLMIDAPDCGQSSDAFVNANTASDLVTFDPRHNIIFSAHAYWYGYANNDSTQMAGKLNAILAQNIPFVLGEIANQQDDASMCQYNLNYKPLLNYCKIKHVNWLAWSWDHDGCPNRQMSSSGNFANLTAYGNDIINNVNYGLHVYTPLKSRYLAQHGCPSISTDLHTGEDKAIGIQVFPNPTEHSFEVTGMDNNMCLKAFDLLGNELSIQALGNNRFNLDQAKGIYLVNVTSVNGSKIIKLILN
jgi:mannan endo-1,4-beta-mannosidase